MEEFMDTAVEEAKTALQEGGIPIGAVLIKDGKIIGRGRDRRIQNSDPIAHAVIDCLRNAGRIDSPSKTILFSTLMPCYLCSGAIVQFRIENLVVGDLRNFKGNPEFLKDHWISIEDWDRQECIELMEEFIKKNPDIWKGEIERI
jgi:cytosine deaminase